MAGTNIRAKGGVEAKLSNTHDMCVDIDKHCSC